MKNIIVVTGASSGMGRSFVKQIEKKEKVDEIWVIARRLERLEELAKEIETPVKCIQMDVSNLDEIKKYKELLESEKPNVKILSLNAGWGKFTHYENVTFEENQNMIDVNIKSTVAFVDYTLPYMGENTNIMILASNSSVQPVPYINMYASTKAFVLSYSRALNRELKYRKIHVMAVTPLWVKTEFFDRSIKKEENPVVINYNSMYSADAVIKTAIKDLYTKKDVSKHGFVNKGQQFLVKILPHSMVMSTWFKQQKLDGTPELNRKKKKDGKKNA